MSDAIPFWRRFRSDGAAARLTALTALLGALGLAGLLIALPLIEQWKEAQRVAANLDRRAVALNEAAAERLAEAAIQAPPPAAIAEATAYLNDHAPVQSRDAAMLDLLSSIRLIAQTAGVTLTASGPVDISRGDARLFDLIDGADLTVLAAEARIVADHVSLAQFLSAIEQARPILRAASMDVTARTARADEEANRLTARILIGAIIREAAPQ